ncbi:class I SAM-dependent methyltransferase [Xylophilus sp. GOD-11R]|uniref:class I SAM-dependent methyltransferase n=1 Tax=Xylophilus sp. GOD-11R TaxID=3089814 RepID=UPI00298CC154|nr:class I SAM-dependent methyltransferase [Xylophilus sp. GOD-11R]WPB57004.1 class I SAM-dependent methyltransferase [Xylophilus sp. GOD-11R]
MPIRPPATVSLLRLPWPLPALLTWAACWVCWLGLRAVGVSPLIALFTTTALGVICAVPQQRRWRRLMVAAGYPLSFAMLGAAQIPAWAWLLPLALLALVYPMRAWHDAPLFPTPVGALRRLPEVVPLAAGAVVLDAGCGLGDGLIALHAAYPQARLRGTEWSWPLRLACALRCPWAQVRQGDIWHDDWREVDLIYLFQRPESMSRAASKAVVELRPGAWLVSLEFPLPDEHPDLRPQPSPSSSPGGKPVWVYRRA